MTTKLINSQPITYLHKDDIDKLIVNQKSELIELGKMLYRLDELIMKKYLTSSETKEKEQLFNHEINIYMRRFAQSTHGFLTVNKARTALCRLAREVYEDEIKKNKK